MSLPQDKFVAVSSVVRKPEFMTEKKHLIFAITSNLIGTNTPYIEIEGKDGLTDFKKKFGNTKEFEVLDKYFSFVSKNGASPSKAIVVRWYKENSAAFIKGSKLKLSLEELQAINNGTLSIKINDKIEELKDLKFDTAKSFSDIATIIETAIKGKNTEEYKNINVIYSSLTQGFILIGSKTGLGNTLAIVVTKLKTDIADKLGLADGEVSVGVNKETYADLIDRIYNMNPVGFSITTLEKIEYEEIKNSVQLLNSVRNGTSLNSKYKLIFNFNDKDLAIKASQNLRELNFTGYVITYDPYNEGVNILDAAIGACIDFDEPNSAVNFNFQKVKGYRAITNNNKVIDYQNGNTDLSLTTELDNNKISYIYSVGVGNAAIVCYGLGLMSGSFGTETVQINESWIESELKTVIMNALLSLPKIALKGKTAVATIDSLLVPVFFKAIKNGCVANGGTIGDSDKITLRNSIGDDAVEAIENTGYYYKVEPITDADTEKKRVRVNACYLTPGVVNFIRIINNIYGA